MADIAAGQADQNTRQAQGEGSGPHGYAGHDGEHPGPLLGRDLLLQDGGKVVAEHAHADADQHQAGKAEPGLVDKDESPVTKALAGQATLNQADERRDPVTPLGRDPIAYKAAAAQAADKIAVPFLALVHHLRVHHIKRHEDKDRLIKKVHPGKDEQHDPQPLPLIDIAEPFLHIRPQQREAVLCFFLFRFRAGRNTDKAFTEGAEQKADPIHDKEDGAAQEAIKNAAASLAQKGGGVKGGLQHGIGLRQPFGRNDVSDQGVVGGAEYGAEHGGEDAVADKEQTNDFGPVAEDGAGNSQANGEQAETGIADNDDLAAAEAVGQSAAEGTEEQVDGRAQHHDHAHKGG